jgi:hypothetical protein
MISKRYPQNIPKIPWKGKSLFPVYVKHRSSLLTLTISLSFLISKISKLIFFYNQGGETAVSESRASECFMAEFSNLLFVGLTLLPTPFSILLDGKQLCLL